MTVKGARKTVTTTPGTLATVAGGAGVSDTSTRSFGLFPQADTGVVLLGPPEDASTLGTGNGIRWDIAKLPTLSIDLEPGESLTARTVSGSIDIDVLSSGR